MFKCLVSIFDSMKIWSPPSMSDTRPQVHLSPPEILPSSHTALNLIRGQYQPGNLVGAKLEPTADLNLGLKLSSPSPTPKSKS